MSTVSRPATEELYKIFDELTPDPVAVLRNFKGEYHPTTDEEYKTVLEETWDKTERRHRWMSRLGK